MCYSHQRKHFFFLSRNYILIPASLLSKCNWLFGFERLLGGKKVWLLSGLVFFVVVCLVVLGFFVWLIFGFCFYFHFHQVLESIFGSPLLDVIS